MDLRIELNLSLLIALALGELVSSLWYSSHHALGRKLGDRYLVTAIICDAALVYMLKYIHQNFRSAHSLEEAAIMSLALALFAAMLEAPHVVSNQDTFSYFAVHVLHKFTLILVMLLCIIYFRHL